MLVADGMVVDAATPSLAGGVIPLAGGTGRADITPGGQNTHPGRSTPASAVPVADGVLVAVAAGSVPFAGTADGVAIVSAGQDTQRVRNIPVPVGGVAVGSMTGGSVPFAGAAAGGMAVVMPGGQNTHLGKVTSTPATPGVTFVPATEGVVIGVATPSVEGEAEETKQLNAEVHRVEEQTVLAWALPMLVWTNAAPSVPPRISTRAVVHKARVRRLMRFAGACFIMHSGSSPKICI